MSLPTINYAFNAEQVSFLQSILIEYKSGNEARNSVLEYEILEDCLAILEGRTQPYPSV